MRQTKLSVIFHFHLNLFESPTRLFQFLFSMTHYFIGFDTMVSSRHTEADTMINEPKATMASGGVEASTSDEDDPVVVMRNGGDNVMRLADVGDNISSTADEQEPSYPPTKEITAADYYNPRNLTLDELEMVLYEWEEEATNIVKEYIDMRVIHSLRTGISIDDDWDDEEEEVQERDNLEVEGGVVDKKNETKTGSWMNRLQNLASSSNSDSAAAADTTTKTSVEFHKHGPLKYLNLTSDTAHVVEFYAPWCPHCQNYKWRYMELAAEVLRRAITPVQFHAVACDLNYRICATLEISGFPTLLGWKQGETHTATNQGMRLNEKVEPTADKLGLLLGLELAHEEVHVDDWYLAGGEGYNESIAEAIEKAHKAAILKSSWHDHKPHTLNDRYHNAALSLAFAVKSQSFQILNEEGNMDTKVKRALVDFLHLLDWASPQSWELRTGFVTELQVRLDTNQVKDRRDVELLIDGDINYHRSTGSKELWGFVDRDMNEGWIGRKNALFGGKSQEELAKDDKHWTKACTHSQPAKGFTCGLWNLFHMLTIGSSKYQHELYGFKRGYFVSPHHVAVTIRNFVSYFLSCDVCREHYLAMWDGCGHDHCNRLKSQISMRSAEDGKSSSESMELALWLWEVHNSVNERLMKEAAQRQRREVTHEETLSSKFPTKKLCPDCWLDENMTQWDNVRVFHFLDEWFWPTNEPAVNLFNDMAETMDLHVRASTLPARALKSSFVASPTFGFSVISLIGCLLVLLPIIAVAHKKFCERRKKCSAKDA